MKTPDVRYKYYTRLDYNPKSGETPKYTITKEWGFMPEMETVRGRDGKVSMYLMPKDRNDKSSTPPMKLQAKGSLNFTGLKDYFLDGKISGFAYGYPDPRPSYSSRNKPNPLYPCKDDGFLFVVHFDEQPITGATPNQIKPNCIELIVIEGARLMIGAYCKQLVMGGFDEDLEQMRKQALSL